MTGQTDEEVITWVAEQYKKADALSSKKEANQIRYRAMIIFDKRFPNPGTE